MSRSLRARGLKPASSPKSCSLIRVALFTGAWIETHKVFLFLSDAVALFTGAWIETKRFGL